MRLSFCCSATRFLLRYRPSLLSNLRLSFCCSATAPSLSSASPSVVLRLGRRCVQLNSVFLWCCDWVVTALQLTHVFLWFCDWAVASLRLSFCCSTTRPSLRSNLPLFFCGAATGSSLRSNLRMSFCCSATGPSLRSACPSVVLRLGRRCALGHRCASTSAGLYVAATRP